MQYTSGNNRYCHDKNDTGYTNPGFAKIEIAASSDIFIPIKPDVPSNGIYKHKEWNSSPSHKTLELKCRKEQKNRIENHKECDI